MTDDLARGIAAYRAGRYWDAHEAWEHVWRDESDPARKMQIQGLIQIAAALHKVLVMNNPAAAARIFRRALAKLESGEGALVRPAFLAEAHACLDALDHETFDACLAPRWPED